MNLEGKELRFGTTAGALWAVSTTSTSNGSVNAMHDSLNPLTGLLPLAGMWLNVIFGGVGVGVINIFVFVITAVFLSGMMVGRTPEYLTRKVEAREMKLALIALLAHPMFILGGTALFAVTPWGLETLNNPGSHGLSEIVYEFSSAAANNGSGFEGLRRQYRALEHGHGSRDVVGQIHSDHRTLGHCRFVVRQTGHSRIGRYLPHRHGAVRSSPAGNDPHCGCVAVSAAGRPGADCRAHRRGLNRGNQNSRNRDSPRD